MPSKVTKRVPKGEGGFAALEIEADAHSPFDAEVQRQQVKGGRDLGEHLEKRRPAEHEIDADRCPRGHVEVSISLCGGFAQEKDAAPNADGPVPLRGAAHAVGLPE